jgi:hypothetical protein
MAERDAKFYRRKTVAVLVLIGCGVVLWLERAAIYPPTIGGFFWLLVALVAVVMAVLELANVGTAGERNGPEKE